jgi:hypothetical protein
MAKLPRDRKLTDAEAIRICRGHSPSGRDIARVVDWAEADPTPEKVAPLLVLFTQWWAPQQYEVPQDRLYGAVIRCAQPGDQALWDCIEGDYDPGRLDAAITVLLRLPGVAGRLPRLFESVPSTGLHLATWRRIRDSAARHGVAAPADIEQKAEPGGLIPFRGIDERRGAWPKERDQLPLEEELGPRTLSDKAAQAVCRKFHPTKAEMRKVIDWAIARPDPNKLRWLFLLCTDYQLGKDSRRWNDAADMLAALDMTPVWEVLEGDREYSRLVAACFLVSRRDDRAEIERLMQLCGESEVVGNSADLLSVRMAAQQLGIPETDAFRDRCDYEEQWRSAKAPRRPSSGEFERRKSNWPDERERLPRPEVIHLLHDTRPELKYSTEPTELTRSLDRIREWLEKSRVNGPGIFRPGLSQTEIAELAKTIPYVFTEELCELYRWADGIDNGWSFLIYYDLFKPLEMAIRDDYLMMCDINDREHPGTWKKNWFPVFNESHDWWIQALRKEPQPRAPMIHYYLAGGEPEVKYRSLTEMMSIWAECYEGGAFSVDSAGELQEDTARFEEIHRRSGSRSR